jgi:hypothetical protein
MRTRTAAQQKISRLYHYQPFDATRLARIFTEGTIYCSNPRDFNDPWDCKPGMELTVLPERDVPGLKPFERVDDFAGCDVGECLAQDIRESAERVPVSLMVAVLEDEGEDGMFHMLVSFGHLRFDVSV